MPGGIWSKTDWLMDQQGKYVGALEPVSAGLSPRDAWSAGKTSQSAKYCSWLTTFQDLGLRCEVQDETGCSITAAMIWVLVTDLHITENQVRGQKIPDRTFLGGQCRPETLFSTRGTPSLFCPMTGRMMQNDGQQRRSKCGPVPVYQRVWDSSRSLSENVIHTPLPSLWKSCCEENVSWTKRCAQGLWTIFRYWSTDHTPSFPHDLPLLQNKKKRTTMD